MFPNPTRSVLNIGINEDIIDLTITNINGQIVKNKNAVSNKQISVADLEKGIYNISVTTANQSYFNRFIVE